MSVIECSRGNNKNNNTVGALHGSYLVGGGLANCLTAMNSFRSFPAALAPVFL